MSRLTVITLILLSSVHAARAGAPACSAIFARFDATSGISGAELQEINRMAASPYAFQSEVTTKSPEFLFYMQLAMQARDSFYQDFIFRFTRQIPGLRERIDAVSPTFAGVPRETAALWKRNATAVLKAAIKDAEAGERIRISTNDMINNLKIADPLTKAEQKSLLRAMTIRTAADLSEYDLESVYEPKVYQFAKNLVRRRMGLDWLPLTDIVVKRIGDKVEVVVVALEPIDGRSNTEGDLGLRVAKIADFKAPENKGADGDKLFSREVRWSTGGKSYSAKVGIKLGPTFRDIAPAMKSLDYDGLWKDGKLAGLILPGANMRTDTRYVLGEYKSYFQENGFLFGRPQAVASIHAFMKRGVSSGEIDYILKEAHSEGSDRELTKLVDSGEIVTGRKELPGGKQEVVYLYYPAHEKQKTGAGVPLEYADFAAWIHERDRNGDAGQLAYLDTSCFGLNSACHLIGAAKSSKLVVVGTTRVADTFTNESDTALRFILDGIRGRKSFDEIRSALRRGAPPYRKDENQYRFPDEKSWLEAVNKSHRSVEIDIKVVDQYGNPFSIEMLDKK